MLTTEDRIDIQIDRDEVLRYLGYLAGHNVPARVSALVDSHIESASQLIEPQYSSVIRNVDRVEDARVFLGDTIFESQIIAHLMQGCQKAVIFAVTIGGLLEMKVQQLAKAGRVLEEAVVDAVGSAAAEQAAAAVQNRVREIANAQGMGISLRFSPGYCDWAIDQQTMIFHALNGRSAGIRLTDSCLMVPRKSVSGVIGMSAHGKDLETWSPCRTCKQRNCPGRR